MVNAVTGVAPNGIAYNSSADADYTCENDNAEHIEAVSYAAYGAGYSENDRAEQVECIDNKLFHIFAG